MPDRSILINLLCMHTYISDMFPPSYKYTPYTIKYKIKIYSQAYMHASSIPPSGTARWRGGTTFDPISNKHDL